MKNRYIPNGIHMNAVNYSSLMVALLATLCLFGTTGCDPEGTLETTEGMSGEEMAPDAGSTNPTPETNCPPPLIDNGAGGCDLCPSNVQPFPMATANLTEDNQPTGTYTALFCRPGPVGYGGQVGVTTTTENALVGHPDQIAMADNGNAPRCESGKVPNYIDETPCTLNGGSACSELPPSSATEGDMYRILGFVCPNANRVIYHNPDPGQERITRLSRIGDDLWFTVTDEYRAADGTVYSETMSVPGVPALSDDEDNPTNDCLEADTHLIHTTGNRTALNAYLVGPERMTNGEGPFAYPFGVSNSSEAFEPVPEGTIATIGQDNDEGGGEVIVTFIGVRPTDRPMDVVTLDDRNGCATIDPAIVNDALIVMAEAEQAAAQAEQADDTPSAE